MILTIRIAGFLATMICVALLSAGANAQEGAGPTDGFGPRDFHLSVDTIPNAARDHLKEGSLVIYDYRKGDPAAEDLFSKYNQIRSVDGKHFDTAAGLYQYITNLQTNSADFVFVRRVDGEEVSEKVALDAMRTTSECAAPTRRTEGVVEGIELCGVFYRIVTPEQLSACSMTGVFTSFLRTRAQPPCSLVGQNVVTTLAQQGCLLDEPSWLGMGYGEDPRNKQRYLMHVRSDLSELGVEVAEASAACNRMLGNSLEPWKVWGLKIGFDYTHFFYFGKLVVADEAEQSSYLARRLKPSVMYIDAVHILFAESASQYEFQSSATYNFYDD